MLRALPAAAAMERQSCVFNREMTLTFNAAEKKVIVP